MSPCALTYFLLCFFSPEDVHLLASRVDNDIVQVSAVKFYLKKQDFPPSLSQPLCCLLTRGSSQLNLRQFAGTCAFA